MCKRRENDNRFPIKTYVASLFEIENVEGYIFNKDIEYSVPIYQRPYSWDQEHVYAFLQTLLEDYMPGESDEKPIFFGTMQFNVEANKKDIVDGQQRLTTFILFLTLLQSLIGNEELTLYSELIDNKEEIKKVILNRNELKVITIPKKKNSFDVEKKYNHYEANFILLSLLFNEFFDNYKKKAEEDLIDSAINSIEDYAKAVYNHIVKNVYFVVMETAKAKMSLSEIVKVFNTINTTGMDLDAADIFKLKFFDYHRQLEENKDIVDETLLDKIDKVYSILRKKSAFEEEEEDEKEQEVKMTWVLDIYKHVLCAAPEKPLGFRILKMSNEAFFDWLFKNIDQYEELKSYLTIESFERLVKLTVDLYNYSHHEANEGIFSLSEHIVSSTRYSRYWTLPYVYSFFKLKGKDFDSIINEDSSNNKNLHQTYNDALKATYSAAKYFIVYSVMYDKVINEVQNEMCNHFIPSFKTSLVYDLFKPELNNEEDKKAYFESLNSTIASFSDRLRKNLKHNDMRARIVCLFSALIDEINVKTDYSKIRDWFFNWELHHYDIEHIEAKDNWDGKIDEADQPLFEGIGNLVVLERSINRDIKAKPVSVKVNYYKGSVEGKENKKASEYTSVKMVCERFEKSGQKWDKAVVEARAEDEIKKITHSLFPIVEEAEST